MRQCGCMECRKHFAPFSSTCPWCGIDAADAEVVDWNVIAVEECLFVINKYKSIDMLEHYFGDPFSAVSGCLRGMFIAPEGYDLICSDYSAIEAVVLACLAGEQWRIDVFNSHGKIYEASAATATGTPLEEILQHKIDTGDHHPLRKLGKVRELAGGFAGGVGAWKNFGADGYFDNDQDIQTDVDSWRAESPNIVKYWYKINDAAIKAVKHPGHYFEHRGITFAVKDEILFCRLLSGRLLKYHKPFLAPGKFGSLQINYWGRNQNAWCCMDTYGGKLVENITQATARDIMGGALVNIARAGYEIVLHVHDEIVAQVLQGAGSIEQFEEIMGTLPEWCKDWPIRAAGGWRGKRYRKD